MHELLMAATVPRTCSLSKSPHTIIVFTSSSTDTVPLWQVQPADEIQSPNPTFRWPPPPKFKGLIEYLRNV